MKILLLAGADGTGILFQPLLSHIDRLTGVNTSRYKAGIVEVINLNVDNTGSLLDQSLTAQVKRIENLYQGERVVLIAESYSGLLAYELLKRGKLNIKKVVFVASFLTKPSAVAPLAKWLNPIWLKTAIDKLPTKLWGRVLFGNYQSYELRALFMRTMADTPNKALQQRLLQIAKQRDLVCRFDVPCLYLQAKQDNLVSAQAIKPFMQVFDNLHLKRLAGTHFLLQTNPKEAWQAIDEFINYD